MPPPPKDRFIRALILDAEGVIIDTEVLWDEVQSEFLSALGRRYVRAELKPLLTGRSVDESSLVLKRRFDLPGTVEEISRARLDVMRARLADRVQFMPGFLKFYEQVADHYQLAIATSLDAQLLHIVDARLHISRLVHGHIATPRDVHGKGKPAPDLFIVAARLVQQPHNRCLVIEDSPSGIAGAIAASMFTVGIATTHARTELLQADIVVDVFDEIDLDELDELAARKAAKRRAETPPSSK